MRHSQDVIHRARHDYAHSNASVAAICRKYGMTRGALYAYLDGGPPGGEQPMEPIPRRSGAVATTRRRRPGRVGRASLVRRMWRAADAQVRDIEERLLQDKQQPDERERCARTMATLVKTIRELAAFDDDNANAAASTTQRLGNSDDEVNRDEVPRDMDEFRRELARRMDAFVASRAGARLSDE